MEACVICSSQRQGGIRCQDGLHYTCKSCLGVSGYRSAGSWSSKEPPLIVACVHNG
jgi:hypothetical protein